MKVVVVGDDGPVGSKLVTELNERGHETVATVAGASVVVDVSFEVSDIATRNLLAAEAAAGVEHHVAVTVNGSVEELIKQSSIPYSIVRSTRFSEDIAEALARIAIGPPANGVVTLDHS
jgi:putative NADH-flavin reductase